MKMGKISREFKIGIMAAAGIIALTLVVMGTVFYIFSDDITAPKKSKEQDKMFSMDDYQVVSLAPVSFDGYMDEGNSQDFEYVPRIESGEMLRSITVSVTWTDEEDEQRGLIMYENQGDEFGITLTWQQSASDELLGSSAVPVANTHGQPGYVLTSILIRHYNEGSTKGEGPWTVTIVCGECGDHTANSDRIAPIADEGNSFSAVIEADVYRPTE